MYNHDWLDDPDTRNNAIIHITTHGSYDVDATNDQTFPVPDGMNVIIIYASAPGTCNFMTTVTTNRISERVQRLVPYMNNQLNLLTTNMSEDTINEVTEKFSDIVIGLHNIDKYNIYENFLNKKLIPTLDPDEKEYLNTFDRSYRVNFYKSRERIFNKIYSRKDNEPDDIDFKINMLTEKYGNEDLMIELTRHRPDSSTPRYNSRTTLEELINLLSAIRVKNVVIFDFSCSAFFREGRLVTDERHIRRERREKLNQETETDLQNKTRKKRLTVDTRGGKRFTRKNRKSRKHFRKSRKHFRTMNKQK